PEHPLLDALATAETALDTVAAGSLWSLADNALEHLLAGAHRLVAKATAARLAVVREVDGRDLPTRVGSTSPAAFLRHRLNVRHADGTRLTRLAADLDGPYQATGHALAAGEICADRAEAVVRTLRALPKDLPAEVRSQAEQFLLDHATTTDPAELAALGKALRAQLTDDEPPDDQDPADRRRLTLTDTDHGTVELRGELDTETAGLLRNALDPLTKPVPAPDGTRDPRIEPQRTDVQADAPPGPAVARFPQDVDLYGRTGQRRVRALRQLHDGASCHQSANTP
nr:DUF222 domain-containing protein [Micromonospora sp. DSM 115978]